MNETVSSQALRARSRLTRAFHGTAMSFLEELFVFSRQNGAKTVRIDTQPNGFTYSDDGGGIPETPEYWHNLLCLPDPELTFPLPNEQAPPGVFAVQLFANLDITEITFASGRYAATIDLDRWWGDLEYFTNCERLISELEEPITGFRVTATCPPRLTGKMESILDVTQRSPARGYDGMLDIFLNGLRLAPEPPPETRYAGILFETTYLGNRLLVLDQPGSCGHVNWFGHSAYAPASIGPFSFYLEVRNGAPLTLLSPVHKAFATDERWEDFLTFIAVQLQHFLFNPAHRKRVKPEWLRWFCGWKPEAQPACPYLIVAPYLRHPTFQSCQSLRETGPEFLKTQAERPFLLESDLRLLMPIGVGTAVTYDLDQAHYGTDSFLPLLEARGIEPFQFVWGDRGQLPIHSVWWKPGDCLHDFARDTDDSYKFFHEPGVWGLGRAAEPPREREWLEVGSVPVFGFDWGDCWEITRVEGWIVGTTNPVEFVKQFGWAGFDPEHDECDEKELTESYEQSLQQLIRILEGKASPDQAFWPDSE